MRIQRTCRGFTLVELLVVIAIIGVLVAAMMPAVQSAREAARRATCSNHMMEIMLAMGRYENAYETLPAGVTNPDGPIRNEPNGLHQSWIISLLPYMEEGNAYRQIDLTKSVYDPVNEPVRKVTLSVLMCPTQPEDPQGKSNYAGCQNDVEAPINDDNHGVLFLNSKIRLSDVTDGPSHTIFVGEKTIAADDLGWMSGTRATLRNTGSRPNTEIPLTPTSVGGFGSNHFGGLVIFGFGDGSVQHLIDEIDLAVLQQLGHRADGKLLDRIEP
jgi:prepilin-type N-terminal cleavage/methylation domain-containing protein